jgi:flagellar hook-basal body complex protein FliE
MGDLRIEGLGQLPQLVEKTGATQDKGFENIIKTAIGKVDKMEKAADQSIMNLLEGKASVHETMIALQKADISMRLLLNVRNKVMEAYREIMHMPF